MKQPGASVVEALYRSGCELAQHPPSLHGCPSQYLLHAETEEGVQFLWCQKCSAFWLIGCFPHGTTAFGKKTAVFLAEALFARYREDPYPVNLVLLNYRHSAEGVEQDVSRLRKFGFPTFAVPGKCGVSVFCILEHLEYVRSRRKER